MRISFLHVFFLSLAVLSCETNPLDTVDTGGAAPFLQSASVMPPGFDLDALAPSGSTYQLNVSLTALVSDPQGASDVAAVTYSLFGPSGETPIASGQFTKFPPSVESQPVICNGTLSFSVNRSTSGVYRMEIAATDLAGHRSATVSQEIPVYKGKSAPVLSLPGARILAQAGIDSTRYAVTITASDSNGLSDVSLVTLRATGTKNPSPFAMYDDGTPSHGDAVAGDGVYSLLTWIAPAGDIHDVVFEFSAADKAGHPSNVIRRPVANATPRLLVLTVPSTIQRPSSGSSLVSFFVGAADANGLSDIDSVFFRNMSSSTPAPVLMYDDGDRTVHGDSLANDGTYSRILSIDASTNPGAKQFQFTVIDRLGARADSTKTITIN